MASQPHAKIGVFGDIVRVPAAHAFQGVAAEKDRGAAQGDNNSIASMMNTGTAANANALQLGPVSRASIQSSGNFGQPFA